MKPLYCGGIHLPDGRSLEFEVKRGEEYHESLKGLFVIERCDREYSWVWGNKKILTFDSIPQATEWIKKKLASVNEAIKSRDTDGKTGL